MIYQYAVRSVYYLLLVRAKAALQLHINPALRQSQTQTQGNGIALSKRMSIVIKGLLSCTIYNSIFQ